MSNKVYRYTIRPRAIGPDFIVEHGYPTTCRDVAERFAKTIGLTATFGDVKMDGEGNPYLEFTIGTDKEFIVFFA